MRLPWGKAEAALQSLRQIMGKLKLTVSEEKTRICKVPEGEFDFLGYTFGRMYSARTGQARIGYRPSKKSIQRAVEKIHALTERSCTWQETTTLVGKVMHLLNIMLKAGGKQGVPQGGVISPLLSNIYLTEVDRMLERAKEASRDGKYTYVEYARFADDLVILIDAYKRHDWLMAAVEKRLREELAELQVEINEEKSRIVDLGRGESFGFLGFDFRQVRSLRGAWRAHYTPKLKKRTALLRKLKDMFGRNQSQPVGRVVKLINPVLRGWVNYFAVGHSSECFSFVKDWVEKKIKRHMQRARNRQGFGWTRWSREWTYNTLGLFKGYRVVRPALKAVPAG